MSTKLLSLLIPLAVVVSLTGQQPKSSATASGVITGRSGKPMANARLILAEVVGDAEVANAKVKLVPKVATAVADAQGRFQFKGFTPGVYTIVYEPAGVSSLPPVEFSIRSLTAYDKSIAPLLRSTELGRTDPYPQRAWGNVYTLMKGHTFWSEGQHMRIWNATVRRGAQGPYLEMRRGVIWTQRFDEGSQIKFETWSY